MGILKKIKNTGRFLFLLLYCILLECLSIIFGFSHYNKIIPGIYLGNINSALDPNFIREKKISVIINCSKDLPFLKNKNIKKIRLPVSDNGKKSEIEKMDRLLGNIIQIIHNERENNKNILIHCRHGVLRSATVIWAYLIKYHNMDKKTAKKYMRNKRYIALSYPFMCFNGCVDKLHINL